MNELLALLGNPLVWKLLLGYWLFNAVAASLPACSQNSSLFYKWFYSFIHALAGNLDKAASTLHVPGAS